MEPAPRRIDPIESAFCGGLAGLLLFVVFDICMVAADLTLDVDPVAYFLTGVAASIFGGIVLSLVLAWLWNRHFSKADGAKGREESK